MIWFFDWTIVLMIPSLILALWAQSKVTKNFAKYSQVRSAKGMTGAAVAAQILYDNGIRDVKVERLASNAGDHYDPKNRKIGLSAHVYDSPSVTALAVAAHEAAHAIQHHEAYAPLKMRTGFFPVVRLSSGAAMPLIMVGLILGGAGFLEPSLANIILNIGIAFFTVTVLFHLITLPVEFNASSRAMAILEGDRYLAPNEADGAKKVLSAAAMTYVAAATAAILQLIRLILISRRN